MSLKGFCFLPNLFNNPQDVFAYFLPGDTLLAVVAAKVVVVVAVVVVPVVPITIDITITRTKMSGWPGHTRPHGIFFLKRGEGGG